MHDVAQVLFGILMRGMVNWYHNGSQNYLEMGGRTQSGMFLRGPALAALFAWLFVRNTNRSGVGITDGERAARALRRIEGKRLTYRSPNWN